MKVNFYIRRAAMHLLASGSASMAEVAKLAGVSRQAVQQWTEQEHIHPVKLRRLRLRMLWKTAQKEVGRDHI